MSKIRLGLILFFTLLNKTMMYNFRKTQTQGKALRLKIYFSKSMAGTGLRKRQAIPVCQITGLIQGNLHTSHILGGCKTQWMSFALLGIDGVVVLWDVAGMVNALPAWQGQDNSPTTMEHRRMVLVLCQEERVNYEQTVWGGLKKMQSLSWPWF